MIEEQLEIDGYKQFVDKFKPKKTTDDCYTPQNIMDAVHAWVRKEYGLKGVEFVRPFYPGGDYENFDYPKDSVVVDNPPFSILSKICAWYDAHSIRYFLFAPSTTLFSTNSGRDNYVISGNSITYENGAVVGTSFVTNMGNTKIFASCELYKIIKEQEEKNTKPENPLPKYEYPVEVVTAATIKKICKYGVDLRIPLESAIFVRALDSQKLVRKAIFGSGFLLTPKAAAEKAAAEKAAAEKAAAEKAAAEKAAAENVDVKVWQISERERALIKLLENTTQNTGDCYGAGNQT